MQSKSRTARALRDEHTRSINPARKLATEALQLERNLSDLVNQAYGLTPEEVKLMWDTAPPRMPFSKKGAKNEAHNGARTLLSASSKFKRLRRQLLNCGQECPRSFPTSRNCVESQTIVDSHSITWSLMAAANDGINGIFNIAMPRYHIHHKPTGTLLARDLYRHQQPWLLDHHSYHEVVPFGSFFEVSDSGDPQAGRLLLDREGLMPLPRDPETETQAIRFILAQDEVTRVAWEQVDIHASHYICVEGGEWELEQADDGDGVCLVAWIRYQSQKQILRAAYGRDEVEAKKRLITAAQQRLEQEAGAGSQPGQILTAKIEMEEAGTFAHTMAIGLAAKKNAVKWLFRAY